MHLRTSVARLISGALIYTAILGLYLSQSRAPVRVHLAVAAALLIGFLLPSLFFGDLHEYLVRWRWVVAISVLGSICFSILISIVVVKAEILHYWYVKYPLLTFGFAILLLLHSAVAGVINRYAGA